MERQLEGYAFASPQAILKSRRSPLLTNPSVLASWREIFLISVLARDVAASFALFAAVGVPFISSRVFPAFLALLALSAL